MRFYYTYNIGTSWIMVNKKIKFLVLSLILKSTVITEVIKASEVMKTNKTLIKCTLC